MADEQTTATEEAPKKRRSRQPRKPDYENDDGVKARKRAANRSDNRGKKAEEAPAPEPEVSDEMPQIEAAAGAEPEALIPEEAPAPAEGEEGGIVAEAQAELDAANAEEAAEGGEGTPVEEAAEGETAPETPAPEAPAEAPVEEAPAPEEPMPMPRAAMQEERVGDYVPPEGASHDELIDQYHEALMFGDAETAKSLYKQLQNHRYMENGHRTKLEAQTAKDAQEYLDTANELAAKHPELGVDGIEADKVMALSDLYRANGKSAVEALRLAVADLYPDEAAAPGIAEEPPAPEAPMAEAAAGIDTEEPPVAEPEVPEPEPEAPAPEEPKAEEAPAEEKPPLIPDMTARNERKRNVVTLPNASARNVPEPPPAPEDRTSALERMRAARGQKG
jgi:nicotinate-nucleotide--dimethylbenzimidazole phosphoribosyltransferase